MPVYSSFFERLVANTSEPENGQGCWQWVGARDRWGYPRVSVRVPGKGPRMKMAHIEMYRLVVGPVPDGQQLDHLCHNEGCINPDHLEPVTPKENCRRRNLAYATIHSPTP